MHLSNFPRIINLEFFTSFSLYHSISVLYFIDFVLPNEFSYPEPILDYRISYDILELRHLLDQANLQRLLQIVYPVGIRYP